MEKSLCIIAQLQSVSFNQAFTDSAGVVNIWYQYTAEAYTPATVLTSDRPADSSSLLSLSGLAILCSRTIALAL